MTRAIGSDTRNPSTAMPHPLAEEFADVVPSGVIRREVRRAEGDLRGQVPGGALPELVHRLARERLRQRLYQAPGT